MFTELFGIAFDTAQDLFVTKEQNELRVAIRKISPTLKVTTIMSARALASFEKDRDGLEPALEAGIV